MPSSQGAGACSFSAFRDANPYRKRARLLRPLEGEREEPNDEATGKDAEVAALRAQLAAAEAANAALQAELEVLKNESMMYSTREKRIQAVRTIAAIENNNIRQSRPGPPGNLADLICFNLDEHVAELNPVLMAMIEAFSATGVEQGGGTLGLNQGDLWSKKAVLRALAADIILKARDDHYVSPLAFILGLEAYSVSSSRGVVELLSRTSAAGSYRYLLEWLKKTMPKDPYMVPQGKDIIAAFDNQQKLFKTYINRLDKQFSQILTNVMVYILPEEHSHMLQYTESWPVAHHGSMSSQDHTALEAELLGGEHPAFAAFVLHLLGTHLARAKQELLDNPPASPASVTPAAASAPATPAPGTRICANGHTVSKARLKRCPQCKAELPPKATKVTSSPTTPVQRRRTFSPKFVQVQYSRERVGDRAYLRQQERTVAVGPASPVKRPTGDRALPQAEVHLLDPVMVNPASDGAVRRILDELAAQLDVGDGPGQRRWVPVCVDGVPYLRVSSILRERPAKYKWIRLLYGPLHEELNMTKALADLAFDVLYGKFGVTQGFISPAALKALRDASDLHKARDLQQIFLEGLLLELAHHFLRDTPNGDAAAFRQWLENQAITDLTLSVVWDLAYLQMAVFAFHDAIRTNDAVLKRAARQAFMPVWFVRNHPNMARVVLEDERTFFTAPEAIKRVLRRFTAVRRHEAYQGLDAILEELNRLTKGWAAGAPDAERWRWVCRCIDLLQKLRAKAQALFGTARTDFAAPRSRPPSDKELKAWRAALAGGAYLAPTPGRAATSLDAKVALSASAHRLLEEGRRRLRAELARLAAGEFVCSGPRDLFVPVTLEEEQELAKETAKTIPQLKAEIVALANALRLPRPPATSTKTKQELVALLVRLRSTAAGAEPPVEDVVDVPEQLASMLSSEDSADVVPAEAPGLEDIEFIATQAISFVYSENEGFDDAYFVQ